jgi:hypothetical protein
MINFITSNQNLFFAYFGALGLNIIDFFEICGDKKKNIIISLNIGLYWAKFFILPFIGVFVVLMYQCSDVRLNPVLSVNIGLSAPAILKSFSKAIPKNISAD